MCSSITTNLFHQLPPAKAGAAGYPGVTSSTDSKKPGLSNYSGGSLEVESGWVENTALHPDICFTDILAFNDSLRQPGWTSPRVRWHLLRDLSWSFEA